MAITWSNIEEGDVLSADTLNAKFADVRGGINELKPEYVKERTLSDKHLPSTIIEAKSVRADMVAGHYYANWYPGHGVDSMSSYDTDGIGWAVLGEDTSDFTAQSLEFDVAHDLTDADVRGVLVMANASVRNIYDSLGGNPQYANPTQKMFAHFMIQAGLATSGAGGIVSWVGIWTSERYTHADSRNGIDGDTELTGGVTIKNGSTEYYGSTTDSTLASLGTAPEYTVADHMNYSDVPIRLFLDQNNPYLTGTKFVKGIRVVVTTLSADRDTGAGDLHPGTRPVVYIGSANLSAMAFQAGGE